MTQTSGELYDLGYQHYQGPREGRMRARKAVFVDGVRTILGLGHGALAKVLPILLFGSAVLPAVILSLIASITGGPAWVAGLRKTLSLDNKNPLAQGRAPSGRRTALL